MALTFLGLFLIILLSAVVGVLAPQLRFTLLSLQENLPQMWDRFWQWAEVQRRHWPFLGELLSLREDQALWEAVRRQIEGQSRSLLNTTVDAAAGALNALANLGIGAVLAIYILAQKESLCHKCKMVLLAWLPRPAAAESGIPASWRPRPLRLFVRPVPGSLHPGRDVCGHPLGLPYALRPLYQLSLLSAPWCPSWARCSAAAGPCSCL